MKVENIVIEVYNNAIKQAIYLNLDLNKENIKKICENNIYFLKHHLFINEIESEKISNFYNKVLSKIMEL
jgi:hypothetical protein